MAAKIPTKTRDIEGALCGRCAISIHALHFAFDIGQQLAVLALRNF